MFVIVSIMVLGAAGCRHAPTANYEGRSGYRFVDPVPATGARGGASLAVRNTPERFVPARPIGELAKPIYPREALVGRAEPATVGVRITVDVNGRVSDVASSMVVFSTPTPFAAAFRAAVEAAVTQWRFTPAEIVLLETVSDPNGDFQRLKSRAAVETTAEVVFTFTAEGKVRG